jgi:cell division protein FtsI/penicillin-binding protein 2
MWQDFNRKKGKQKILAPNNRLSFGMAIIFLLFIALAWQLVKLQIIHHDKYLAYALNQHQILSELKPERGKIFLQEIIAGQQLPYLVATNKDYAFIYIIPKDIEDPDYLADKFYQFFDKEDVLQDLELTEIEDEDLKEIYYQNLKEEKINQYLKILDKPGDPYEPFLDKVDDQTLLSFFAFLISDDLQEHKVEDLIRNRDKIYFKDSEELVNIKGLSFSMQKYRFYPEPSLASHLLGFVGIVESDFQGRYGIEEFFEKELAGKEGYLKTEKGAGNTVIINDREYLKPKSGNDLLLTIDRSLQYFVCQKLEEAVAHFQASGGSVIIVETSTGAIRAMCSNPSYDPNFYRDITDISIFSNPAIYHQFEPGSTFKTITAAAAINENKINPNTTFFDEGQITIKGWPKPIRNSDFFSHGGHGLSSMQDMLEKSLNTGAIFAMRQIGPEVFAQYLKDFGFGEKTGIELGAESSGNIDNLLANRVKEIDAATASFGQGIAVTPLQMLMSYQALANNGYLMKPYVVSQIIDPNDNEVVEVKPQVIRQVVSEKTAQTILAMLVNVVEKGHTKRAMIPGYYIGGKTGTAQIAGSGGYISDQHIHVFTGVFPIDSPRFAMIVKIDKPQGVRYAESSAVPLWKEIAEFSIKHYQIAPSR